MIDSPEGLQARAVEDSRNAIMSTIMQVMSEHGLAEQMRPAID